MALPPAERFALVQALWDSLRAESGVLPVSEEERALVPRRRADLRRDPDAALVWDDVRTELWAEQEADERAAAAEDSASPGAVTPARLRVHPAAREEMRAARRYYTSQWVGLGRTFLAEVDAVVAFALEHPEMYPASDDGEPAVRRALLHRFRYALVHEVAAPGPLVVLTCFDLRQEHAPDWQARR